jgi:hypothetical protein
MRIGTRSLAHLAALAGAVLMIWSVGQPIFTDDLWWHLALGRAFWREGPWLAVDPLLFGPAGAPSPSAWLFDVALFGGASLGDFGSLRVLHAALVALILSLVWSLARRASSSASIASTVTVAFIALAAYRLFQLRPDLISILATLLLYRLLIEGGGPPSPRAIAAASAIAALWANVHAAFVLGPLLLVSATAATGLYALRSGAESTQARARAARLALATVVVGVASLANPLGAVAYLAYFRSGSATPALAFVADEWARFPLTSLPTPTLPPTLLAWILVWLLPISIAWTAAMRGSRGWRRVDPALVGLSAASLALLLVAVRFLWLGIFPMLWVAGAAAVPRRELRWGALAVLLLVCFVRIGDWPLITRALPLTWSAYQRPYPPAKYFAHSIWFLRDSGLSGNLYNEYFLGGFAGFWLAPDVRTMVNGTLNVAPETLLAHHALARRQGASPGEDFTALLDRMRVDLFLGIRPPEVGHPTRPWTQTTSHLERTPGWIPVFRSLASAVYLRLNERNRENLERVARYYAAQQVPFDPVRGFEVAAVIRESPDWAIAHGIAPRDLPELERAVRIQPRSPANDRLATLYAALGLYERAAALDRNSLRAEPDSIRARRRLVWSALRMRRFEEAEQAAASLSLQPVSDHLSHKLSNAAAAIPAMDRSDADAAIALLPFLYREEVPALFVNNVEPRPRRFGESRH